MLKERPKNGTKAELLLKNIFKALALALLFVVLAAPKPGAPGPVYVRTAEGRRACIEGSIFLRVPYSKKGGFEGASLKYTGDAKNAAEIRKNNPSAGKKNLKEIRIPLELLLPAYRAEAIKALFPGDKGVEGGWSHVVRAGESFHGLAKWFCGSSKKSAELMEATGKRSLRAGETVLIPEKLLAPPFSSIPAGNGEKPGTGSEQQEPPAPAEGGAGVTRLVGPPLPAGPAKAPPAELSTEEARKLLTYGKDEKGDYALYHLAQGEALYSAVVVRFTGRLYASEVNALAMDVAARSGIADVTSIPVGYEIKIPLDLLLPQFYPEDSEAYKGWQSHQAELSGIINTYKNASLEGVVVILDPGHGGLDRGAIKNQVWEDSYVYDIACRIREGLESKTKAKVFMTMAEPAKGFKPIDKPGLSPNKKATLLTHPPFNPDSSSETKAAVNLRWLLSNYHFNALRKEGVDPERIIFTSIHADSLHPSVRGTMFYIPGSLYRKTSWSVDGKFFQQFKEWKSCSSFSMSKKELETGEGLSNQFARKLQESFKKNGLKLHPYSPTRDHVVRSRKAWVPAVLKYNIVPCSILIEVCNINNKEDAALMRDPVYRQKVANAYIEALILYYS